MVSPQAHRHSVPPRSNFHRSLPCACAGPPPEERTRRGISDSMLRLSIGLEGAADLIADLGQALARYPRSGSPRRIRHERRWRPVSADPSIPARSRVSTFAAPQSLDLSVANP
ncbi:MAG: PLP-dependent transferase [Pseudomonadota bacterium]